jgi:hypothetical protein
VNHFTKYKFVDEESDDDERNGRGDKKEYADPERDDEFAQDRRTSSYEMIGENNSKEDSDDYRVKDRGQAAENLEEEYDQEEVEQYNAENYSKKPYEIEQGTNYDQNNRRYPPRISRSNFINILFGIKIFLSNIV